MAHYFFDLHEAGTVTVDPEGRECLSMEAARLVAVRDIKAIICDDIQYGQFSLASHIDIMGSEHQHLARISFGDAVKISG